MELVSELITTQSMLNTFRSLSWVKYRENMIIEASNFSDPCSLTLEKLEVQHKLKRYPNNVRGYIYQFAFGCFSKRDFHTIHGNIP